VVMRVFIDYPSRDSGLPEYLQETVSCEPYTEHGGGCSPDYSDPLLQQAILDLIAKFGERYNGDPRIGFIQVGILGFWGEWHTWPHTEWFPSEDFQNEVLHRYAEAFPDTHLQVRNPVAESVNLPIGFHDDSFAYSTLGELNWFFYPKLQAAGADSRWKEVPIGGELRPELQSLVFQDDYEMGEYSQDVLQCIAQVHATYILNYWAFNGAGVGYQDEQRRRAEEASLALGYQFELQDASLELSALQSETLQAKIVLRIAQTGVAPFYYPLFVSLLSEDQALDVGSTFDLSALQPGEYVDVELDLGRVSTDLFQERLSLQLRGDILLEGQQIHMPTLTPDTEVGEPTGVRWPTHCVYEDTEIALGATLHIAERGEDCRCDVDRQFHRFDGRACFD